MEVKLSPHFGCSYLSDIVPDLMMMWEAATLGWVPQEISEEDYLKLRDQPPSAERGFAGFGATFGGKWFGGYGRIGEAQAHRNGGARSASAQSARTLTRDAAALINCHFRTMDYRDVFIRPDDVVYCDPPYAGTTEYEASGVFDTAAFWHTMDDWVAKGAHVFISQSDAPEGWSAVWDAVVPGSLDTKTRRRERLWRHHSQITSCE